MYELEINRVADEIVKRGAKRVLLQLPDGLRPEALKLVKALKEKVEADLLLLGDSCYGACDVALRQAQAVGADLIVHYGHSMMLPNEGIPVVYVEARVYIDVTKLVELVLPLISGWRSVGLAATVQHIHQLREVARALEKRNFTVVIGPSGSRVSHDGQVLGCDYSSAVSISEKVDGFLFVGGGRFHPLGLAISTGKPVAAADPYQMSATEINEAEIKKLAMKRMAAITAAKAAKRFGIIVSIKPGQLQLEAARSMRSKLHERGREAAIICVDEVRADSFLNFSEVDAFIDTACPRIALDGIADLHKPIITQQEALVMLGEKEWTEKWLGSYLG